LEPLLNQVAEEREARHEGAQENYDDVRLAKDSSAWQKGSMVTDDDRQMPRLPWETFKVWC